MIVSCIRSGPIRAQHPHLAAVSCNLVIEVHRKQHTVCIDQADPFRSDHPQAGKSGKKHCCSPAFTRAAAMDDPLTGGFASRLADEDEEAEAQSSADALLREPDVNVPSVRLVLA